MRQSKWGKKLHIVTVLIALVVFAMGCGETVQKPEKPSEETKPAIGFSAMGPTEYDSMDTALLTEINPTEGTLRFLNLELEKYYTLSYDGTTTFTDKYGAGYSLVQFVPGNLVDVKFVKDKKHLTSMKLAESAWSYNQIDNYEFNFIKRQISVGKDIYKLSTSAHFLSGKSEIEEMEIHSEDVITIEGIDTTVYSIRVDKGHGYLRLKNDENFIGGWIEVGSTRIFRITDDMLLTVPEGKYAVTVSNNGSSGTKDIVINKNTESVMDVGDIVIAQPKSGTVLFSITPSEAKLYVDGTQTDSSYPVTMEYGLHQLIVKADGFKTITQYIRVGQESAGVEIALEPEEDGSTEESSQSGSELDVSGTGYKVYIEAPRDVEVYVDSRYVGVTPCNFAKEPGSHAIVLRKTGYEPRSFQLVIDEEKKDVSYSFTDLEKTKTDTSLSVDSLTDLVTDILGN